MHEENRTDFDLENHVLIAQKNASKIDYLLKKYMPFIKKVSYEVNKNTLEYDDALSISMIAFVNAIKQFDEGRGNFISFAKTCIRNRLIDEIRKTASKNKKVIPLFSEYDNEEIDTRIADGVAICAYNKESERNELKEEIEDFDSALKKYSITFDDLPEICPKHEKSKKQCFAIAFLVANDGEMYDSFEKTKRLKQSELAIAFKLSKKTIEKHRKYIVSLIVLLKGDYPAIRTFIPSYREIIDK